MAAAPSGSAVRPRSRSLCRQTAAGMNDDVPEFSQRARYHEDVHHKLGDSRRRRRHDLGIAFDDDGVFVMGIVAVRAKKGLAHRHEAGDLEKSLFSHFVRKAVPWPVSCSRDCAPVE